ncbi:MAG: hypothetical protein RIC36_14140 [Rhodospirillales bacterium]
MLSYIRGKCRAASLICALLLSACQTTSPDGGAPYSGPLSADEELLRTQSDGFVTENVAGGALAYGTAGCLALGTVSIITNGDIRNAGTACLTGLVLGGVAGGVDGYMKAKEAQQKADRITIAKAMADDVRAENEKLSEMVATSRRIVETDRRRIEDLARKVDAKILTLEQARAEAGVIRNNSAQIENILQAAREKRDGYQEARRRVSSGNTAELDAEIARLNVEINELEKQLDSVNTTLRVTGLG